LNAMARSGLTEIQEASFEKDGKTIAFRKVWQLTPSGEANPDQLVIREDISSPVPLTGGKRKSRKSVKQPPKESKTDVKTKSIEAALKAWRLEEAKKHAVPAFTIFPDKTLRAIADHAPTTEEELLEVPGMGRKLLEKYGAQVLKLIASLT
jgi:superfamily II DNA helicase RecQ